MKHRNHPPQLPPLSDWTWRSIAVAVVATLACPALPVLAKGKTKVPATAVAASAAASVAQATSAVQTGGAPKDIVLDATPAPAAVPASAPPAVSTREANREASRETAVAPATVTALNELALELIRQQAQSAPQAKGNLTVSPYSLMAALGMVHAGVSGAGAAEIAALMGGTSGNSKAMSVRWPQAYKAVALAGQQGGQFSQANRIWVSQLAAPQLTSGYASLLTQRYGADGAVLDFNQAEPAREAINAWAGKATQGRLTELLGKGAVQANTRVVLTNAVQFKAPWAKPFDRADTRPVDFTLANGQPKAVPTMSGVRGIKAGVVDNITVYELPFAGGQFALRVAMPPAGHSLQALLVDQDGSDLAAWGSQLKATTCRVSLPRFKLGAGTLALKPSLQAMGVRGIFEEQADFSAMLGKAAKGVHVDDVYQSAQVTIDEEGGQAVAATAATMQVKSFQFQTAECLVNRPFLFSIVHLPTQVPVFVGQVQDPTQP